MARICTITHWLPIVTFCPVNNLPDLIYVSITFEDFQELYEVRRKIKRAAQFKKMFMEDICTMVYDMYPTALEVQVRLVFSKHTVNEVRNDIPFN